ncbi:MAG: radical SAM protein, partial [Bacteroidales bacterium]|nr:radical SAM protein [Bacteroidales bacterium]
MFIEKIKSLDWSTLTDSIYSKTAKDVEVALAKDKRDLEDFKALISPAAAPYLEQMAALSSQLTQKRFGKNIQLYVPLYLSNYCENRCVYCGFNAENKIKRTVLSGEEIVDEMEAISKFGFKHILLVTGEASKKAGIDYLKTAFELIKPKTSLISIEVQPLEEQGYRDLVDAGLHTVYLYQETYNHKTYKKYHLGGKKADFDYRMDAYERMGKAGVYKIGLGILAGLEDWRTDSF